MKKKIITSHLFFLAALISTILVSIAGNNFWLTLAFGIFTLLTAAFLFTLWMRYIAEVVMKSDKILNKDEHLSKWSFDNFDKLQINQSQVAKKFEVAAELITNLSNPEKSTRNNLLENDPIGKALQNIRLEMLRIKSEDDKRVWISQGLARFSEILRNKVEVKEYSHQIISNLVKYCNANQGGLFIEYENSEGERYLELTGCYAYEKRKYLERKVFEGQGLLGQCMLEKDFIFITDVPNDYLKITSGLGFSTPHNIVVIPLMFNEKFCGAIELASFEVMEPHQIEFLKKVCENIASEIASLKNTQHAQALLEESNTLTQELQSREEEMKQNLEELAATQEEMARKQAELSSIVNAIDITLATAEFDHTGRFKSANDIFLKVMGYELNELLDRSFGFLMGIDQSVVMMWENLKLGKFFSGEFKMKDKTGRELWLSGTFNPIFAKGDSPEKIMMFAQFTTQEKEKMNDLNGMVHALKSTLPIMEFNEHFACKTANEKAFKFFGVSRMELRNKTILDFIEPYYHHAWKKKLTEVLNHEFSNFILPLAAGKQIMSYEVSFSVIKDSEGKVIKIIALFVKEIHEKVSILAAV